MNTPPRLLVALLLATLAVMTGCRHSSEIARGKQITPLAGSTSVDIPGPSTIRPDGSVRNRHMDRPDGHLLRTSSTQALRAHQVDPWARNETLVVAADSGLTADDVTGWLQITGPRMLVIDDTTTAEVYDVTLEVWKIAATPPQRERQVD
ncbi:MAG: hypothetical protein MK116_01980 [Phycisphaerales bacterium]|nr:hypothetical protein [Phycisphaerales bacterium]